jgi:Icc-related predicted phosphoesterase
MGACFFVADLHGDPARYRRLFEAVREETPAAVFLGGDLLPAPGGGDSEPWGAQGQFLEHVLASGFRALRGTLGARAPRVFLIFGNDDLRANEAAAIAAGAGGVWEYAHLRQLTLGRFPVYGYACVPPTPFRLKDWERYDVSRYVDPGCVSPEGGWRSVASEESEVRWGTMEKDLARLTGEDDLVDAVFLFHSPPYETPLDRAGLDGARVEHVPLDVHVGSIAIRRFIERRQPLLTLHGHVHESSRLTGAWRTRIGRTHCLSAAHDGPELALVRFDPEDPAAATRELLPVGPPAA